MIRITFFKEMPVFYKTFLGYSKVGETNWKQVTRSNTDEYPIIGEGKNRLLKNYKKLWKLSELFEIIKLSSRRKSLFIMFAQTCLKSETNINMFSVNAKAVNTGTHKMYFVIPAVINILGKSIIPSMHIFIYAEVTKTWY